MKWIKKFKITETAIRELFLIAGFFMLGYGLWIIYEPSMFLVCGTILMWLGLPPRKEGGG